MLWLLALAAIPASAQLQIPRSDPALREPAQFATRPIAESAGVVSWKTLSQVDLVKENDRYSPRFSQDVQALAGKPVKLQGFMVPLEAGDKQKHFLLSASPQTCAYCMPGGPESLVDVTLKDPVKYGFEPILISGKLVVMKNDPMGLYYRIADAIAIK
ncbi:MAG: DUF3299 domain-containing protein [Candidatus Methylophosphatis roskildensis]